jgi:hypothetical protein
MLPLILAVSNGLPVSMEQAKKLADGEGMNKDAIKSTLTSSGVKVVEDGNKLYFNQDEQKVTLIFNDEGKLRGLSLD